MKILKVLGVVVAIHATVFIFVLALPGCRSTGASTTTPAVAEVSPIAPAAPAPAGFDPDAPAAVHYSPTRPGTPEAAEILPPPPTPAPIVVVPAPVAVVAPTEIYVVQKNDALYTIAKSHGVSARAIADASQIKVDSVLRLGQKLVIPAKSAAAPAAVATADEPGVTVYTVLPSDTLGSIARRHGTTSAAVKALNKLSNDTIIAGQHLKLPPPTAGKPVGSVSSAPAESKLTADGIDPATGDFIHIVLGNEKLSTIAHKFGVKPGEIATANAIKDPNKLNLGQRLKIPGYKPPGGATSSSASGATELSPITPAAPADSPISPAPPAPAPAGSGPIRIN